MDVIYVHAQVGGQCPAAIEKHDHRIADCEFGVLHAA
jgi:hypothetical protein